MGGGTKKHKKDRDSRKHRRSRSPNSPEKERRHKRRRRSEERREDSDSSDVVVIETPIIPSKPSTTKSSSPIPDGGAGACLSIHETNKLRAKLGLKPLEVESSKGASTAKPSENESKEEGATSDKKHKDDWGEFYHKPATNIADLKNAEKIREKIRERREKRKLEDKLKKTKSLGESDEDDDINRWVERNRDRELMRKAADKRAKMIQEMDDEFGIDSIVEQEIRDKRRDAYKTKDLKGIRVEHDLTEFTEGKSIILTLKDSDVLAEDGDTLINVNIADNERYKKNVENKKFKIGSLGYNCYDEEMDDFGAPVGRAVLKKYDEEIRGAEKKSFVIGQNVRAELDEKQRALEIKCKLENKRLESLTEQLIRPASEYYTEEEMVKFKKPKKKTKAKKIRSKLSADDLLPLPGQSFQTSDLVTRKSHDFAGQDEVQFKVEVDDDLEKVLSKARRLKQREALITQSTITAKIETEIKQEDDEDGGLENNIVLNETAEFCRTLGDIPTYGMAGNREADVNDMMDLEEATEEVNDGNDVVMEPRTGTWNSVRLEDEPAEENSNPAKELVEAVILDNEPDVGSGVAAALRLAMSKGYLEKEEQNKPSNTRFAHLQAKNYSIEDKTYNEDDKFGRRDRYHHSGPVSDFREKETFKPNVKLEYIDDIGRILNSKEAFRYLSHKFHGKGPGKNKIEKRLKKMEQDGLMMKMSSTDTPLGTLNMLQAKQLETQSPFVVLSGGKQTANNSTTIVKPKMK